MFERHIYNEEFFKFIKQISNGLDLPDLNSNNTTNHIYNDHANIPYDKKQICHNLIRINGILIFNILARAHDNNSITDLTSLFKKFLSLTPEAAFTFFDTLVLKDPKRPLDILLNCPDRNVRECVSQILLHFVNVIISYHELSLDLYKFNNESNVLLYFSNFCFKLFLEQRR